ncbi:hypothetical protein DPMN_103328 [Dreissena polymorpha]|uniref:Uncharacterized protein n=1 Tax=Dreissena polymorpha TaxID=45954 RepID=A0A9D4K030_DREPO|nr:hypothetical protein DPMN_103328 [Dreissena polymorpha]
MKHSFESREERLLSQEMKLRDMEISLSERMQKLECKLEMRENRTSDGYWKNERNETVGKASVLEHSLKRRLTNFSVKSKLFKKKKQH